MDGEPGPKVLTESQAWVHDLCAVLGWDYRIGSNAGRAAKLGKELRAAGGTLAELREHYAQADTGAAWWWYRDTWQGRDKRQHPTPAQITETWGRWELPIPLVRAEPAGWAALREWRELRR